MKILFLVHQYFPHHTGGTEVYTRGLVRRARAAGHEVLVLTCREDPRGDEWIGVEEIVYEGVPVREIHFNLSFMAHPARAEYSNPAVAAVVARELRRFAPDVVHALHAMKFGAGALEACHEAGVPVVLTLCDFWFLCPRHTLLKWNQQLCDGPNGFGKCVPCVRHLHGFARPPASFKDFRGLRRFARDWNAIAARREYLKRAVLGCERIIALSEFTKSLFVQNGYPAARLEVITHGLETDDLELSAPTENQVARPLRVGFIGTLLPHKGAHVLLEACALIPDAKLECLIYGPLQQDEYSRRLQALAARDGRVRLMGGFAPAQTGQVFASFDVLAMPVLWYENQPLVVKAAQYLGVPVLASDLGCLPEMIHNQAGSRLIAANSPDDWARALSELALQPRSVRVPVPVKTMDENAREMLQIYDEIFAARRHQKP